MAKTTLPATARRETLVESPNYRELIRKLPKGKTPAEDAAEMVADGVAANVCATFDWCEGVMTRPDVTSLSEAMYRLGQDVQGGNLGTIEAMLSAQVVTLNAAFVSMMQRAKGSKIYGILRDLFAARSADAEPVQGDRRNAGNDENAASFHEELPGEHRERAAAGQQRQFSRAR